MSSLQALILSQYPTPFFSLGELALAFFALGPLPSFVSLVLLLSMLITHGQRISRRHTRGRELLCSWASVTAGSSLAHWRAATSALSSPAQSLTATIVLSGTTYLIVVLTVYLYIRLKGRMSTDWAQFTLFPALWATSWCITSHISPVGRLLNWWPSPVPTSYDWLLPITGPSGIDWVVAAWAVVCSEVAAQWLMGFSESDDLEHNNKPMFSSRSKGLLSLVAILLALTFFSTRFRNPPSRTDVVAHTPFTVGCVLPVPVDRRPTLEDYISETARMNVANVILWPESAVVFNSEKEREDAFARIRKLSLPSLVGVAFDEYAVGDPEHTRNGFALVHKGQKPGDETVQYYKRHLVPFTESFSKIPSVDPPVVTHWELKNPKGVTKPDWAPDDTNHTRPLAVTSSICLDFTSPTVFSNLGSRPALILGPARTWDTTVGLAMWEQAKARANELGSMVLWCDGGSTGVSGIGGGGLFEPMQTGGGTWMRTVRVGYPFDERRTPYAIGGDMAVIVMLGALTSGRIAMKEGRKVLRRGRGVYRLVKKCSTRQNTPKSRTRTLKGLLASHGPSPQVRISRTGRYTTSAHNFLQSKLPRGLRGSLRSSTHSFDPTRLFARAFPRTAIFGRKSKEPEPEPEPEPDDAEADFELIAAEDVPPPECPSHAPDLAQSDTTPPPRSKSSLFRLKNISKVSIHLSSFTDSRASSSRTRTATDESDLCLAFPKPPSHIPTPEAAPYPPESSSSPSVKHDAPYVPLADQDVPEQHTKPPVLVSLTAPEFSKLAKRRHTFAGPLKRFKSLSQILRDSFASHPIDASSVDTIRSKNSHKRDFESNASTPPINPAIPSVPELPTNLILPSSLPSIAAVIQAAPSPTASISSLPEQPSPPAIPIPPPLRRKYSAPAGLGRYPSPVAHYRFVNPSDLAGSPSLLNSTRSSVLPPSPSWLSRNVNRFDPSELSNIFPPSRISALSNSDHLRIPEITTFYPSALFAPDSPYPLPIPPPLVPVPPPQSRQSTDSPTRPILQPLRTNVYPDSPASDSGSFVTSPTPLDSTLYSPTSSTTPTTAFASALPSPSPQFRRRLSNISQISAERHRHSIARLKKSRTYSPRTYHHLSYKASRTSLNPLYKDLSIRNQLPHGPKFHFIKAPPSPVSRENSDNRTIFKPSKKSESPLSKQSPLPKDLSLLLEAFSIQSGILNSFARPTMDYTGKNLDVVDFGGEVDYSGRRWFLEPPPRPEPPPVIQPYKPGEDVIRQNGAFDFALRAAPNVLYGRFKQYGQLGVLAWCSEFGEMVDSLKALGFAGNMFTATRVQALRTCEEILKLKLDIKMQIILMYLSSQVARLRRFLDSGNNQWDDYPVPEFPMDYRAYSS